MSRQTSHISAQGSLVQMANTQDYESQISCTEGPARFLMTSDGNKDCLALLVPKTFVKRLADLFNDGRSIDAMKGHLRRARMDAQDTESSIEMAKQLLDTVENPDERIKLQEYVKQQESRLLKVCKRRDRLEGEDRRLRHEVEVSKAHTEWVLETAMERGNLLKPHKSSIPFEYDGEQASTRSLSSAVVSTSHTRSVVDSVELRYQEARNEVRESWYELEKAQRLFDDKEREYEERLVDWKHGEFDISRSEFDRRMLVYNQQLTGALIDCEASFENAKGRADQLSVSSSSSRWSIPSYRYEGCMSPEEVARHASSLDRSSVDAWRASVPTSGYHEDLQVMHPEHVDAGLVEISDSASAADDREHTKMINRWQKARGVYEGINRPRTNDMLTRDVEMLDRRHSS